jgi:signal transduction histidine kinase
MNHDVVTVKRSAFLRATLGGHFLNIVAGLLVFSVIHWVFSLPTIHAVVATIITTVLLSILVSVLATKRLTDPMKTLNQELSELHQRIEYSQQALTRSHQGTRALMEELPAGILGFDKNFKLTTINKHAAQTLGFDVNNPDYPNVLELFKEMRTNGKPINFIDWLHQAKSTKIQVQEHWSMTTLKTHSGVKTFDILASYNKNDSFGHDLVILLVDRKEEGSQQEKQMEFIALAAHELRGPITVMRGLIDVFEGEVAKQLDGEHKELLTRLGVSARQLAGYVDNILNTSRVEQENFEVQRDEADWTKVLKQATADLAIRAEAHHRHLDLQIPGSLPTVAVDPTAIQHVINNLVDNAIKYSKSDGTVVVTVKQKDDMIETTVQDFGIGIPASVVDSLFTKFYRSHRSKQAVGGTGLGLYLCKAIVEAHGGNIWVRSTEGMGTTFGFTLPTYSSVAATLNNSDNTDSGIIRGSHGWIKNHALYRR